MTNRKLPPPLPPPSSQGIICANDRSLNAAFINASRFNKGYPRIATLPDIVDARLLSPSRARVWNRQFTTLSAEYVGLSRQNNLVMVVAHGLGPLADRAEELRPDDPEIDADCRVEQQDFLNLLDGLYGEVAVIDLKEYLRRYRLPFQEPLTLEQAAGDPLALARLGPKAPAYLERQSEISARWIRASGRYATQNRCVLKLDDAADFNYCWTVDAPMPVGHFLAISSLFHYRHCHWETPGCHDSCLTEIACRNDSDGPAAVIGMRGDGELDRVHPGEEIILSGLARHWRRLLRPNSQPPPADRLYRLARAGWDWFTLHHHCGSIRGACGPEYPVVKISERTPMIIRVPIRNDDAVPIITHCNVAGIAPPWFNAYHVPEEPWTVWRGDDPIFAAGQIDFYRITVDVSHHIPPPAELREDFDLLLSLSDADCCRLERAG